MTRINLIDQLSTEHTHDPIRYSYWKNYTTDNIQYWCSKVDLSAMRDTVAETKTWVKEEEQIFLLELIYEEGL